MKIFFSVKKKTLLICLSVVLFITAGIVYFTTIRLTSARPNLSPSIVIDAGHGGEDGGAVGKETGITESYLNLQYALALKEMCESFGMNVTLTRSDMNGLYSNLAKNKKKSEMKKREEIIKKANADVVVSIHMNSFPLRSSKGAQVFYAEGSEVGSHLAECVQTSLHSMIENARAVAKEGDYYILKCSETPSILVECGFLTNPDEEIKLADEAYMQNLCYSILVGVLSYFN